MRMSQCSRSWKSMTRRKAMPKTASKAATKKMPNLYFRSAFSMRSRAAVRTRSRFVVSVMTVASLSEEPLGHHRRESKEFEHGEDDQGAFQTRIDGVRTGGVVHAALPFFRASASRQRAHRPGAI